MSDNVSPQMSLEQLIAQLNAYSADEQLQAVQAIAQAGKVDISTARKLFKSTKTSDTFAKVLNVFNVTATNAAKNPELWAGIPDWDAIKITIVFDNLGGVVISPVQRVEDLSAKAEGETVGFMDKAGTIHSSRVGYLHANGDRLLSQYPYQYTKSDGDHPVWEIKKADNETAEHATARVKIQMLKDTKASTAEITKAEKVLAEIEKTASQPASQPA